MRSIKICSYNSSSSSHISSSRVAVVPKLTLKEKSYSCSSNNTLEIVQKNIYF